MSSPEFPGATSNIMLSYLESQSLCIDVTA